MGDFQTLCLLLLFELFCFAFVYFANDKKFEINWKIKSAYDAYLEWHVIRFMNSHGEIRILNSRKIRVFRVWHPSESMEIKFWVKNAKHILNVKQCFTKFFIIFLMRKIRQIDLVLRYLANEDAIWQIFKVIIQFENNCQLI